MQGNGSNFNLKFTFFSNVIQNYRSNFKNTRQKYDKIKYGNLFISHDKNNLDRD